MTQKYFNEKIRSKSAYIFFCLLAVGVMMVMPILYPILKPHRIHQPVVEWSLAIFFAIVALLYFLFLRVFDHIHFDHTNKIITITMMTLFDGDQIRVIPFDAFRYVEEKDGSLELLHGKKRIVTLKRRDIGEYTFDRIKKEVMSI